MALGHRDPTAPGVCVALDFIYTDLMSAVLALRLHLAIISQYYEHVHKTLVLCSLDIE